MEAPGLSYLTLWESLGVPWYHWPVHDAHHFLCLTYPPLSFFHQYYIKANIFTLFSLRELPHSHYLFIFMKVTLSHKPHDHHCFNKLSNMFT